LTVGDMSIIVELIIEEIKHWYKTSKS